MTTATNTKHASSITSTSARSSAACPSAKGGRWAKIGCRLKFTNQTDPLWKRYRHSLHTKAHSAFASAVPTSSIMLATTAPPTSTRSSLADTTLPTNSSHTPATAAAAVGGPIVRQSTISIQNTPTNLVLMSYTDRTVVLVTQLAGRVGTLIQVESASPTSSTPGDTAADAADSRAHLLEQRLLGAESPTHNVYATEIAHVVSKCGVMMPVLVGLGLKRLVSETDHGEDQEDLELEMVRLKEVVAGVEAIIRQEA